MRDADRGAVERAVQALASLEASVPPREGRVDVAMRDGVAWISLDNPRAHNALTVTMMRQLGQAVLQVGASDVAVVALGSLGGGSFCSGGHLGQVRERLVQPDAAAVMSGAMTTLLDALGSLSILSVAVVEGPAIGGGVELCAACDLCFATEPARFEPAQVRLGVAAGWGGAARVARRVGRARALRWMASGRSISAQEARSWGFVDHVGDGKASRLLRDGLGAILEHDASAVRAIKAQVLVDGAPEAATRAFLSVWGGPAHLRALGVES